METISNNCVAQWAFELHFKWLYYSNYILYVSFSKYILYKCPLLTSCIIIYSELFRIFYVLWTILINIILLWMNINERCVYVESIVSIFKGLNHDIFRSVSRLPRWRIEACRIQKASLFPLFIWPIEIKSLNRPSECGKFLVLAWWDITK